MEYYIGSILLLPYNLVPRGALLCNGKEYPAVQYEALYSIIRNTYGGSVSAQTFAVPNMLGMEPILGMNYYIVAAGYYPG